MWKKLFFVTSFVLVLAFNGTVRAASIDINNPSFEWGADGNRVPGHGTAAAWLENAEGAGGWTGADVMCPYALDSEDPLHCHRWPGPTDPCGTGTDVVYQYIQHDSGCNIYQILDMNNSDANGVITNGRRYTLRWDALVGERGESGNKLRAVLFYVLDPCYPDVNHAVLSSKDVSVLWIDRPLFVCKGTSNLDAPGDCPDWNYDFRMDWVAGADYDGNTLGIKFQSVGQLFDDYTFIDNIRLDWQWATQAFGPNPDDGATDVPKDSNLIWSPGLWTQDVNGHNVYFGSTYAEVDSATTASPEFKGAQSPNEFDPGTMILGETYYWRIDEVNVNYQPGPVPIPPNNTWKGEIWSFTVAGRAKNPYPSDSATDVPKNVILRWTAGAEALYHDVYFGTTESAVDNATTASGEYKDRTNLGTEQYDPVALGLTVGNQYFWRIDEVNTLTVKGNTWDFTVADYILVDDFDFYVNNTALLNTWDDTTGAEGGGGYISVNTDANYAVDGNSMMLDYTNTAKPYYSQTARTYASAQDWTYATEKVTALEINWFGDVDNGSDPPMYVRLSDGTKTVQVDPGPSGYGPNDVTNAGLNTWRIPLKDFNDGGVNLANITKITLGIGDGVAEAAPPAEAGTLYFDEIRLLPPSCYPDFGPKADFTGDCRVDVNDLRTITGEWCRAGYWGPPSPVVEYLFEEGSGTVVANAGTLGSSYDLLMNRTWTADGGTVMCPNNDPCWVNDSDPCRGWTMWFDGERGRVGDPQTEDRKGGDYLIIPPMNLNTNAATIAAWLKPDPCFYDAKTDTYSQAGAFTGLVHNRRAPGDTDAAHETAAGLSYGGGGGFTYDGMLGYVWNDNASSTWNWDSGIFIPDFRWTMNVLVVEPTQAIVYLYDPCDTPPISSATNAIAHSVEEFDWRTVIAGDAGGGADRFFRGQMDAVRIYGFSLTKAEVQDVVNDVPLTGTMYFPLASNADLCVGIKDPCDPCAPIDDQVDLCDFSKFADEWLEYKLWPLP